MSIYPEKIGEIITNLSHIGKAEGANAVGTAGCFGCGGIVRFSLRINVATKEIEQARFQTNACGYLMAAADVVAGIVEGKKLTESESIHGKELSALLAGELGEIPNERMKCLDHCIEAFNVALADFRAFQLESYHGDQALVCTCFGVSEAEIEKAIKENRLDSVSQVTASCKAGGGCGSCQPIIQELLDLFHAESPN